jgi:hypothetical protein
MISSAQKNQKEVETLEPSTQAAENAWQLPGLRANMSLNSDIWKFCETNSRGSEKDLLGWWQKICTHRYQLFQVLLDVSFWSFKKGKRPIKKESQESATRP